MDNAPEKKERPKLDLSLSTLGRHLIFLVVALTLTVIVFEFWGQFGHAMGTVLSLDDTSAKKDSGEVTVTIIPAKPCPKDQKCR